MQFPENQFSQHSIPRICALCGLLGVLSSSLAEQPYLPVPQKAWQQPGRAVPSPGSYSPGFPYHKGLQSCSGIATAMSPVPSLQGLSSEACCSSAGWTSFDLLAVSFPLLLLLWQQFLKLTKCPWLICPAFVCLVWYKCSFYGNKPFVPSRTSTTNTDTEQGSTALLWINPKWIVDQGRGNNPHQHHTPVSKGLQILRTPTAHLPLSVPAPKTWPREPEEQRESEHCPRRSGMYF